MRLGERLDTLRQRQFVGRGRELALFEDAIRSDELPFHVLHVVGPGGIGKTTLLNHFVARCREFGISAIRLDARNIEPTPVTFLQALADALNVSDADSVFDEVATQGDRHVIVVDTYELLAPIDSWIRQELLPELPVNVLLVTGGRNMPAAEWRIDPGLQSLVHTLPLRNLDADDSSRLLSARNVPSHQHHDLLEFTHGHPLALALIADVLAQRPLAQFKREDVPDVIRTLLELFVEKVPGPAHRAALESCALVRVTTEPLLSEMLALPDVHELFEWLRSLSFIESGKDGLFPHDLAREALSADVRWRNPVWYTELHHRARSYYAGRLKATGSAEQQRVLLDYAYLHRDNPIMREIFQWHGGSALLADQAHVDEYPVLEEMVRQHEGEASAEFAGRWFRSQPEGVLAVREAGGKSVGMLMMIRLQNATQEEIDSDPATHTMWQYLQEHAPLRPGQGATCFRFWMSEETYQSVSPVQSIIFVNVGRHYLIEPGLAFTFFPCSDPEFWGQGFAYIDLQRLQKSDFTIGERKYGVYGHDWRVVTPDRWLEILAEREMGGAIEADSTTTQQVVVLSESSFAEEVRRALRHYCEPEELQRSPLLRSRLVLDRAGESTQEQRVLILRQLIDEAAERLHTIAKGERYYRALHRTYLKPVATQERAAELLNLPFSTYRRHLATAVARIIRSLWQLEAGWAGMLQTKEEEEEK